jgi:hypothetical protein
MMTMTAARCRDSPPMSSDTDILTEAHAAVYGERHASYGPPIDDFTCQAQMFSAYLSRTNGRPVEVQPDDIAALMVLVKVARQAHAPKRDNWVDMAGYAACGAEVDAALAGKPPLD